MAQDLRLGDLLVQHELITPEQLKQTLAQQSEQGGKLGQLLVEAGFLQEMDLLNLLSEQLSLPFIDLGELKLDPAVSSLLPEAYARRFRALVIADNKEHLLVGMSDPVDIQAADEVQQVLGRPVKFAIVRESQLLDGLNILYRHSDEITQLASQVEIEANDAEEAQSLDEAEEVGTENAPVVKLLKSIFEEAVQINASDIHIEPGEHVLRIRLRVDGLLQEQSLDQIKAAPAMISRLKLMSGLNVAEKRLPQDGRFTLKVHHRLFDVRLSTLPTAHGESVVMRLLDREGALLDLHKIGLQPEGLEKLQRILQSPYGVVLVTGPTGSGKTTTLYGIINSLNSPEKKIITAEDPIEYQLPRVVQVQTKDKIDLTFTSILRTALRQDPDIVLVGEMRDEETADVAMRAALTGHLVLSTLHTNDAASTVFRLVDMGVEGYLVAASLQAVVAQRLVRKICENCQESYEPSDDEKTLLTQVLPKGAKLPKKLFRGKGCSQCNQSGYRGREGIFEILEMNETLRHYLRSNDTAGFNLAAMEVLQGQLLRDQAVNLALAGKTTLQEVVRVTGAG